MHQLGELTQAADIYKSILTTNPSSFDAFNLLGLVELQCERYIESLECFKQAIRLYPANPSFYFNLACALDCLGRQEDALSVYKEAINLDPAYAQAYYRAGTVCQKLNFIDLALSYFDQAIDRNSSLMEVYLAKGALLSVTGKFESAIDNVKTALALVPDSPDAHLNLGLIYEHRNSPGDLERSIDEYSTAANLRDQFISAVFNRGNAYQKLGLWDQAIKDYQLVIHWDEKFAPAYTNLGLVFYKQAKHEQAIHSFESAIKLDPTHAQTYSNLGVVLYDMKRLLESLAAYANAIQFKPDYFEAFSNQGNVYKELRQFEAALQSYDQAIELKKDYFEAYVNRGVVYFELNRLDEALGDYDKAIQLNPDYPTAYSNLANVFKERGNLVQALGSIKKAVQLRFNHLVNESLDRTVLAQKPMEVQEASSVLLELHSLLGQNNIPFFLAYGTLLGIYRDAELLPHDKDLDVGLDWNCSRDELIRVLSQSGRYWIDPKSANPQTYHFNFGVVEKRRGISIDFFFFKPDGAYLLSGFHHLPNPLLWRFNKFELKDIKYKNQVFKIPAHPETYLIDIYGPNWHVPDPYFDSLVSGYNLTEESKPLSLIYAYSRLFDYLMEQNWKKAYGYCVQIKTYKESINSIDELMEFLEFRLSVDQSKGTRDQ